MSAVVPVGECTTTGSPQYGGLRMGADSYLALSNDGFQYELVDGVVVLSPIPTPKHQSVLAEISYQIMSHLRTQPVGSVFPEVDVRLSDEIVYRPELVFIRKDRVAANWRRILQPPDMVVEIVSPDSLRFDAETKRNDYERFGVTEFWLIDPDREELKFHRLEQGTYKLIEAPGAFFSSVAVPGFVLNLDEVRRSFHPL